MSQSFVDDRLLITPDNPQDEMLCKLIDELRRQREDSVIHQKWFLNSFLSAPIATSEGWGLVIIM